MVLALPEEIPLKTLSKCKEAMRTELARLRGECGRGAPGADLDEARAEAFADGYARALETLGDAGDVRPVVERFAAAMEAKLRLRDYRGGWQNEPSDWLLERLQEEVEELEKCLHPLRKEPTPAKVLDEAVDVANFAMFIADVRGALKDEP
jgi:hypothetical protein